MYINISPEIWAYIRYFSLFWSSRAPAPVSIWARAGPARKIQKKFSPARPGPWPSVKFQPDPARPAGRAGPYGLPVWARGLQCSTLYHVRGGWPIVFVARGFYTSRGHSTSSNTCYFKVYYIPYPNTYANIFWDFLIMRRARNRSRRFAYISGCCFRAIVKRFCILLSRYILLLNVVSLVKYIFIHPKECSLNI
jgi:hypothetical protein